MTRYTKSIVRVGQRGGGLQGGTPPPAVEAFLHVLTLELTRLFINKEDVRIYKKHDQKRLVRLMTSHIPMNPTLTITDSMNT